jgi:hypothetical protein
MCVSVRLTQQLVDKRWLRKLLRKKLSVRARVAMDLVEQTSITGTRTRLAVGTERGTLRPLHDNEMQLTTIRDSRMQSQLNAGQTRAIRDARPSASWSTGGNRQQRMDQIPERIWKQRGGHTPFTPPRRRGQTSEVLIDALRVTSFF